MPGTMTGDEQPAQYVQVLSRPTAGTTISTFDQLGGKCHHLSQYRIHCKEYGDRGDGDGIREMVTYKVRNDPLT